MTSPSWGVLLLAHGTVSDLSELPRFLTRIRRGRAPSPELVEEMRRRYRAIGGSPLLSITQRTAEALARRLGRPCGAAMRLSSPEVGEVWPQLAERGAKSVCLLPLAPFSVQVYVEAARESLPGVPSFGVEPWGEDARFIAAQVARIEPLLTRAEHEHLVLTAHSLPQRVIDAGDPYAAQFERCAARIGSTLGLPFSVAYQSQGADGGHWLGPELNALLSSKRDEGVTRVVVAPVGFLSEHVETLYDLDIETRRHAEALGLEFARVPALDDDPALIDALAHIAEKTMAEVSS